MPQETDQVGLSGRNSFLDPYPLRLVLTPTTNRGAGLNHQVTEPWAQMFDGILDIWNSSSLKSFICQVHRTTQGQTGH